MEMEKKLGDIHCTNKVPSVLSRFQLMVYYFYGGSCCESTWKVLMILITTDHE